MTLTRRKFLKGMGICISILGLGLASGCAPDLKNQVLGPQTIGYVTAAFGGITREDGKYIAHLKVCTPESLRIEKVRQSRSWYDYGLNYHPSASRDFTNPDEIRDVLNIEDLVLQGCKNMSVDLRVGKPGDEITVSIYGINRAGEYRKLRAYPFILSLG